MGTFSVLLAANLVGSILTIADTGFPRFNPAPGCKAASAINQSIDLAVSQSYDACIADEESAKKELQQSWSKYSVADTKRCVGQTEDGGMPSYVEVLECLLVTINVDNSTLALPRLAAGFTRPQQSPTNDRWCAGGGGLRNQRIVGTERALAHANCGS